MRVSLVAELVSHVVDHRVGVLDDVVQQRGGDRLVVQPQLGADLRRAERVVNERLARAALLAFVSAGREVEGAGEQIAVDLGVVGRNLREELLEEIFVPVRGFDESHGQIVDRTLPLYRLSPISRRGLVVRRANR
jgi:hypothetical protein